MIHSLHIGIDDYPTAPLQYCVSDAMRMQDLFNRMGSKTNLLINEQATIAGIRQACDNMLAEVSKGDTIVITNSSHGTYFTKQGKEHQAIVPYDYRQSGYLIDTAIGQSIDEQTPSNCQLTLFMDCCHAGSNTRSFNSDRARSMEAEQSAIDLTPIDLTIEAGNTLCLVPPTGRSMSDYQGSPEVLFAGCASDQLSWESSSVGGGYFTSAVIEAFNHCQRTGQHPTNIEFINLVRSLSKIDQNKQRHGLWCCDSQDNALIGEPLYSPEPPPGTVYCTECGRPY